MDATEIPLTSQFSEELTKIIVDSKPHVVLESGTYKGEGSSRIIVNALGKLSGIRDFYTIEVSEEFSKKAITTLRHNCATNVYVCVMQGLSIPKSLLPTGEEIQLRVDEAKLAGVQVDHNGKDEVYYYSKETNIPEGVFMEDLIGNILHHKPEVILLDSGGHIGEIECKYVVEKLNWPCFLCLDDTKHIKHYKSLKNLKADSRFQILVDSNEKYGFAITKFTP